MKTFLCLSLTLILISLLLISYQLHERPSQVVSKTVVEVPASQEFDLLTHLQQNHPIEGADFQLELTSARAYRLILTPQNTEYDLRFQENNYHQTIMDGIAQILNDPQAGNIREITWKSLTGDATTLYPETGPTETTETETSVIAPPVTENPPQPDPDLYQNYIVQPGETLHNIAQRFGTTVNDLLTLNNLTDPNLIIAGQTLRVPTTTPATPPTTETPPTTNSQAITTRLTELMGPDWEFQLNDSNHTITAYLTLPVGFPTIDPITNNFLTSLTTIESEFGILYDLEWRHQDDNRIILAILGGVPHEPDTIDPVAINNRLTELMGNNWDFQINTISNHITATFTIPTEIPNLDPIAEQFIAALATLQAEYNINFDLEWQKQDNQGRLLLITNGEPFFLDTGLTREQYLQQQNIPS